MTHFVEPKIRPLVEALHSWQGIETFSSCEGHPNSSGPRSIPHVTFTCEHAHCLKELCAGLKGTGWKITLDDLATGPDVHYTLRYVPNNLNERRTLEEIQAQVHSIADIICPNACDLDDSGPVKDNYPVLNCPNCDGASLWVEADICFDLEYSEDVYPAMQIRQVPSGKIVCKECSEEIRVDDPAGEIWQLINRAHAYNVLDTSPHEDTER